MGSWSVCLYLFSPVGQSKLSGWGPHGWASVCFEQWTVLLHGSRSTTKKSSQEWEWPALSRPTTWWNSRSLCVIDAGWDVVLPSHPRQGCSPLWVPWEGPSSRCYFLNRCFTGGFWWWWWWWWAASGQHLSGLSLDHSHQTTAKPCMSMTFMVLSKKHNIFSLKACDSFWRWRGLYWLFTHKNILVESFYFCLGLP